MKVHEHLDSETKRKLGYSSEGEGKVQSIRKKRNKRKSERLSERDLKELMGQFEPTFRRKNGAWRSK